MEVLKDIPGYQVILKAVLKGQIQYLVEQLADHTGEESVILTASVVEGSLSHLGSESGKVFLQDHDDIKSQFLGFCIKRHHRRKSLDIQPTSFESNDRRNSSTPSSNFTSPSLRSGLQNTEPQFDPGVSQFTSPPVHPVSLARTTSKTAMGGTARPKPYNANRPTKTLGNFQKKSKANQSNKSMSGPNGIEQIRINSNEVIKIETADQEEDDSRSDAMSDASNDSGLRHIDPSQLQAAIVSLPLHNVMPSTPTSDTAQASFDRDNTSDNSKSAFSDSADASGLVMQSDKSDVTGSAADYQGISTGVSSDSLDSSHREMTDKPTVKIEAVSEAEMDLEIIGVEPGVMTQGHMAGDNNWMSNVDEGLGAFSSVSGGQHGDGPFNEVAKDSSPTSPAIVYYDVDDENSSNRPNSPRRSKSCPVCCKVFASSSSMDMHLRVHTGEKPFSCDQCGKLFNQKGNLKAHRKSHSKLRKTHGTQTYIDGHEKYKIAKKYRRVRRTKPCPVCEKLFPSGSSLEIHIRTHTGEKPFSCDVCGKPFAQKGNLIKHTGSHYKKAFKL